MAQCLGVAMKLEWNLDLGIKTLDAQSAALRVLGGTAWPVSRRHAPTPARCARRGACTTSSRAHCHVKIADWPENHPHPLTSGSASKLATLLTYCVMDHAAGVATGTFAPTGFQGGLRLNVDVRTTHATDGAEREAAEVMVTAAASGRRVTLGADEAYDAAEHAAHLRAINVTPHVAQNRSGRRTSIEDLTTRHPRNPIDQRRRTSGTPRPLSGNQA
jgi:IS5 family transposase